MQNFRQASLCPWCGMRATLMTAVGVERPPQPGDQSICGTCGERSAVGPHGRLVPLPAGSPRPLGHVTAKVALSNWQRWLQKPLGAVRNWQRTLFLLGGSEVVGELFELYQAAAAIGLDGS